MWSTSPNLCNLYFIMKAVILAGGYGTRTDFRKQFIAQFDAAAGATAQRYAAKRADRAEINLRLAASADSKL